MKMYYVWLEHSLLFKLRFSLVLYEIFCESLYQSVLLVIVPNWILLLKIQTVWKSKPIIFHT